MKFRMLLKTVRREAGLSQAQLAAKLRRPQSYISKAESGERRVDVVELVEMLRALGVDTAAFCKRLNNSRG